MANHAYFDQKLFRFLRDLRENNNREWFQDNKPRYEANVRDPMLRFITDFAPHLKKISPHVVADARANGGSFFRIYRDTRFSKDKTPYKTNAGAHFRHERAKDAHAPGFYLHLEPGGAFVGIGIWQPDGKALAKIRKAIDKERAGWKRATSGKAFQATLKLTGETLKRPPKDYAAEHPFIVDLMRKDFIAVTELKQKDACAADFMQQFAAICRAGAPLNKFLAGALGLKW